MNNEMQRFDFKGAALRTLTDENGEPWFVAKDVCDILEISNPSDALKRLDDDERSRFNLGRQGETNIVNEAGLYVLVLGSRKPEAHEFKRWVTHEVLPQIRKTGGYIPTTDADDDMTILAKAVMIGQRTMEEQKRKIAAQQTRIDAGHLVMVPPKTHDTHRDGTTFSFAPTVKITRKGLGLIARRMSEATLQLEYTKAGA